MSVLLAAVTSIPGGCVALCRKHRGRKTVAKAFEGFEIYIRSTPVTKLRILFTFLLPNGMPNKSI